MGRKKNKNKNNKKNSVIIKQKNEQIVNPSIIKGTKDNNLIVSEKTESKDKPDKYSNTNIGNIDIKKDEKSYCPKNILLRFIDAIIEKQILSKVFIILFATFVFSYAYSNIEEMNRKALSYIGLILCMVVCYVEILGIRDHLWIIEGSIPSSRRWREAFFNPASLRKYKYRRVIAILFAYVVFCYIYKMKALMPARDILSFLGIILMITTVYYEVLAIRDEVNMISKSIKYLIDEKKQGLMNKKDNEEI